MIYNAIYYKIIFMIIIPCHLILIFLPKKGMNSFITKVLNEYLSFSWFNNQLDYCYLMKLFLHYQKIIFILPFALDNILLAFHSFTIFLILFVLLLIEYKYLFNYMHGKVEIDMVNTRWMKTSFNLLGRKMHKKLSGKKMICANLHIKHRLLWEK